MDSRLLFALLLICLTATTLSFSEQISLSPLKEEAPRLSLLSTTSLSVLTASISSLIICWRSSRTVLTPLLISSSFPMATPKFYPTAPSPVRLLRQNATKFLLDDVYRNPGPLQYDGPGADAKALSLCVEDQNYMGRIKKLQEYLDKVRTIVKPGCSQDVLKVALSSMASVTEVLSVMSSASNGGTQE